MPRWLYPVIGVVVLIVGAEIIGRTGVAGKSWPPLTDVVTYLSRPVALQTVLRGFGATAMAAGAGLVAGVVFAMAAALISLFVPVTRPGLDRLAALLHAVPLIALAPLLITTVGREATPTVVAALGVGFVMFVSFSSGLAAASASHGDMFTVFGANRLSRLTRLQLPAALPILLDGLALAAPTAVLGATIGEWFGAPRGLGVLIVSAMQNFQIPLLWSAALGATLLSLAAYLVVVRLQAVAVRRFT
jgi:ABC-type nitrate/sulfonate/bicarbonate transport system permease component